MASVLEEDRKEAPKEAALNEELRRKLQEFIDGEVGGSWVLTELKNSTHELFKDSTKNDLKQLSTHFDEFADIVIRRFKELVIRKGSCPAGRISRKPPTSTHAPATKNVG